MDLIFRQLPIRQFIRVLALAVLIMVLVGTLVTLIQPKKFRSSVELLVLETQTQGDVYATIRSAEKLNATLAQLTQTTSFTEAVLAGAGVSRGLFPTDPNKLKKEWKKTVQARVIPDTGLLHIDVYHQYPSQAIVIAESVSRVIAQNAAGYTGSNNVAVTVVDGPVTSRRFVKPNIALNLVTSVLLGLFLSLGYLLLTVNGEAAVVATTVTSRVRGEAEPARQIPVAIESGTPASVAVSLEEFLTQQLAGQP